MIRTIKVGYTGPEVYELCTILGHIPGSEYFSEDIRTKVVEFQKKIGLNPDGIVGPNTWLALFIDNRMKVHPKICEIKDFDYEWAGKYLGCEPEALMAVVKVETGGKGGFLEPGKPQILFEGHVFWRELKERGIDPEPLSKEYPSIVYPKWTKKYYLGGLREYDRFNLASRINLDSAICATSWGMFQVLGDNYKLCSCKNPEDFHDKVCRSQLWQFVLGMEFIRNTRLYVHLEKKDWASFAKGYNGPGYKENKYDEKLKKSYESFRSGKCL